MPELNVIVVAALAPKRMLLIVLVVAIVRAAVVSLTFWVAVAAVMSVESYAAKPSAVLLSVPMPTAGL